MNWKGVVLIACLTQQLVACKQRKEAVSTREMTPDAVYFDYQVKGSEDDDRVTVLANFREFDEYGYALKLDTPSTVKFDGELMQGTTLKIPGTYYEIQKDTASFAGQHQLEFTDIERNRHVEKFNFQPLALVKPLPEKILAADLELELLGLERGDRVHILLTDTAYASEGLEREDTVLDGKILITAEELAGLAEGPVQLELVREQVRDITREGHTRGRLTIRYGIKKEFLLRHPKKEAAD